MSQNKTKFRSYKIPNFNRLTQTVAKFGRILLQLSQNVHKIVPRHAIPLSVLYRLPHAVDEEVVDNFVIKHRLEQIVQRRKHVPDAYFDIPEQGAIERQFAHASELGVFLGKGVHVQAKGATADDVCRVLPTAIYNLK